MDMNKQELSEQPGDNSKVEKESNSEPIAGTSIDKDHSKFEASNEIEDEDEDEEELTEGGKVLQILVEKHDAVENTISLIKGEVIQTETSGEAANEVTKFEGLRTLFDDPKVKSMIKSSAGKDTHDLLADALGSIETKLSFDEKRRALLAGAIRLRSNLNKADKSEAKNDPKFQLALSLIGQTKDKLRLT